MLFHSSTLSVIDQITRPLLQAEGIADKAVRWARKGRGEADSTKKALKEEVDADEAVVLVESK